MTFMDWWGEDEDSFRRALRHLMREPFEAGVASQKGEIEQLRAAFAAWEQDPHTYSKRPCGTCRQVTAALGTPFGCVRFAQTGQSYVIAAEAAKRGE